jgi:hypothetical protein
MFVAISMGPADIHVTIPCECEPWPIPHSSALSVTKYALFIRFDSIDL